MTRFAKLLLAATVSGVVLTSLTTAHAAILGLWRFDEGSGTTTADASGWANPAATFQAQGESSLPTWVAGHTGGALEFSSGSNNNLLEASIAGAVSGSAEMHQLTYAAWVYNNGQTTFGRVIEGTSLFYVGSGSTRTLGSAFPNTTLGDQAYAGPEVPTGQWSHVAVVLDRDKATGQQSRTYYVNGVATSFTDSLTSSGTSGSQLNDRTTSLAQTLLVGNRSSDWARAFEGTIDDLAVFNQALSQSEIQTIMNGDFSAHVVDRTVALGKNLIVNGNAESDPGDFDNNRNLRVTGWQDAGWTSPLLYKDKGGESWAPNHTLVDGSLTADGGNNFFTGGRGGADSIMTQDVDVFSLSLEIDSGATRCDLSGWFGTYAGDNDRAYLTARFLDGASGQLGTATIGGYGASDLGNQTKMLFDDARVAVPVNTRTIQVELFLDYPAIGGGYNDAMADNLSLVLTIPEPASLAMFALGGLLAAIFFRRGRR